MCSKVVVLHDDNLPSQAALYDHKLARFDLLTRYYDHKPCCRESPLRPG